VEDSRSKELLKQLMRDIKTWENQSLEFKRKSTSDHKLAEAIASFATANVGRIYIGVDPDKRITGVDGVDDGEGRDRRLRRIAHITKTIVKPPIRVKVLFINTESGTVVRIDVPKGTHPVYYVDYRPWIRDLSTARKLEPSEVEKLYYQYFLASITPSSDETRDFLLTALFQLSDVQVLSSDYKDHLIRPDIDQMQYDLGSTGRRFRELSVKQAARDMGISYQLEELGANLEDLEAHRFYLNGGKSVDKFGEKLKNCAKQASRLYEQVKKNLSTSAMPNYSRLVIESISSLRNEWSNAPRYKKRRELDRLRESFRRLGFTFHRLGSLPDADTKNVSIDLREVGLRLRNLSSVEKYFLPVANWNPIERAKKEIREILNILESVEKRVS